jgi:peptidoglycan/xylan/chitin deacetylase (PgdA/CDA1 family)
VAEWPGGARGALCLSFDNLGTDESSSATRVLPALLERLAEHGLTATFFSEGINAELDPNALCAIVAAGHEVAYHAWQHEERGELTATEQAQNLARGVSAFGDLGIDVGGLRPPGGQLGEGGVQVLREAGLRYVSPAGAGAGIEDGVAILPFEWHHVDATCLLPLLGAVREQMTGAPDQLDPTSFVTYIQEQIDHLERDGGFMAIVLHLPLLDWLSENNLATVLDKLSSTRSWVARCDEAADHIRTHPDAFAERATLDPTSWT